MRFNPPQTKTRHTRRRKQSSIMSGDSSSFTHHIHLNKGVTKKLNIEKIFTAIRTQYRNIKK